jgi:hypothetical protein
VDEGGPLQGVAVPFAPEQTSGHLPEFRVDCVEQSLVAFRCFDDHQTSLLRVSWSESDHKVLGRLQHFGLLVGATSRCPGSGAHPKSVETNLVLAGETLQTRVSAPLRPGGRFFSWVFRGRLRFTF